MRGDVEDLPDNTLEIGLDIPCRNPENLPPDPCSSEVPVLVASNSDLGFVVTSVYLDSEPDFGPGDIDSNPRPTWNGDADLPFPATVFLFQSYCQDQLRMTHRHWQVVRPTENHAFEASGSGTAHLHNLAPEFPHARLGDQALVQAVLIRRQQSSVISLEGDLEKCLPRRTHCTSADRVEELDIGKVRSSDPDTTHSRSSIRMSGELESTSRNTPDPPIFSRCTT